MEGEQLPSETEPPRQAFAPLSANQGLPHASSKGAGQTSAQWRKKFVATAKKMRHVQRSCPEAGLVPSENHRPTAPDPRKEYSPEVVEWLEAEVDRRVQRAHSAYCRELERSLSTRKGALLRQKDEIEALKRTIEGMKAQAAVSEEAAGAAPRPLLVDAAVQTICGVAGSVDAATSPAPLALQLRDACDVPTGSPGLVNVGSPFGFAAAFRVGDEGGAPEAPARDASGGGGGDDTDESSPIVLAAAAPTLDGSEPPAVLGDGSEEVATQEVPFTFSAPAVAHSAAASDPSAVSCGWSAGGGMAGFNFAAPAFASLEHPDAADGSLVPDARPEPTPGAMPAAFAGASPGSSFFSSVAGSASRAAAEVLQEEGGSDISDPHPRRLTFSSERSESSIAGAGSEPRPNGSARVVHTNSLFCASPGEPEEPEGGALLQPAGPPPPGQAPWNVKSNLLFDFDKASPGGGGGAGGGGGKGAEALIEPFPDPALLVGGSSPAASSPGGGMMFEMSPERSRGSPVGGLLRVESIESSSTSAPPQPSSPPPPPPPSSPAAVARPRGSPVGGLLRVESIESSSTSAPPPPQPAAASLHSQVELGSPVFAPHGCDWVGQLLPSPVPHRRGEGPQPSSPAPVLTFAPASHAKPADEALPPAAMDQDAPGTPTLFRPRGRSPTAAVPFDPVAEFERENCRAFDFDADIALFGSEAGGMSPLSPSWAHMDSPLRGDGGSSEPRQLFNDLTPYARTSQEATSRPGQ